MRAARGKGRRRSGRRERGAAGPPARLRVRVEKLVAGGLGLARDPGGVVLVEDAAPGDLLEVELLEGAPGYRRARALRVLEPGPGRREAPCSLASRCGGCDLQHLRYDSQLEAKVEIVKESLTRLGKLEVPEPVAVHPSPEWGYRRRARLHARRTPSGVVLGFRARRSRGVVDLPACPVLAPRLEDGLGEIRAALQGQERREREVSVLEVEGGLLTSLEGAHGWVRVGQERLRVDPEHFFQASAPLLEPFVARVVELAWASRAERAYDLYAGVGLFSLPLARRFGSVLAVEGRPGAARHLEASARAAGRPGLSVLARPVEEFVAGPEAQALGGQTVVVDPPRTGLGPGVRRRLGALRPGALVYVSCDPATLARDARSLVEAGLALHSLDVFDLFPQTSHVETVARLGA